MDVAYFKAIIDFATECTVGIGCGNEKGGLAAYDSWAGEL